MITQTFFVPGPLPGLNEIMAANLKRRGKWNAYDDMKREWDATVVWQIRCAKLTPVKSCSLVFTWREPTMRRDPDNIVVAKKFLLDSLVVAGVLKNDGWKQVKAFKDVWEVNKQEPGVTVEIRS